MGPTPQAWSWFHQNFFFEENFPQTAPMGTKLVCPFMKTTDAFVFFLIGLGMCFGPAVCPDLFSGEINGGGTGSELWLMLMGGIQMLLGAWAMGLNAVPRLMRQIAEWEPVPLNFELVDLGSVLSESFYDGLAEADEVGVALNLQRQLRMGFA